MTKLNILRLKDQHNWAYCHIAREQAKYSQHNILCKRLRDITFADLENIDILYLPGPNMGKSVSDKLILNVRRLFPKCKIIGGYAGEHDIFYPDADIIVSISAKFYPKLKKMYQDKNIPVVFLPESVDTEFFTPGQHPQSFGVGWSGRVAPVKRCHLLDKLPFIVERQSDHGTQFFKTPGRSLEPMKAFYQSLSALVLTSSSEAMPRVVLEAMACGLPVVATDVGSLRMLLEEQWLVPVNPEEETVKRMSNLLNTLYDYPHIIKYVGERNRRIIEQYFSWKVNMPMWDKFFELLVDNNFKEIENQNSAYRHEYGQLEPALWESK